MVVHQSPQRGRILGLLLVRPPEPPTVDFVQGTPEYRKCEGTHRGVSSFRSVRSVFVVAKPDSLEGDRLPAGQLQDSGVLAKAEVLLGHVHKSRIVDVIQVVAELDSVQVLVHCVGTEPAFAAMGDVTADDIARR